MVCISILYTTVGKITIVLNRSDSKSLWIPCQVKIAQNSRSLAEILIIQSANKAAAKNLQISKTSFQYLVVGQSLKCHDRIPASDNFFLHFDEFRSPARNFLKTILTSNPGNGQLPNDLNLKKTLIFSRMLDVNYLITP